MNDVSKLFLNSVGKNIKKKRQQKGLSMQKLGYEVGLSRMQIHRIEKGYNITMITLLKISLALNASTAELTKFDFKTKKEDLEWLVNNNKANRKE
jgi:transcriptional regulator with XRE-family HTH domain